MYQFQSLLLSEFPPGTQLNSTASSRMTWQASLDPSPPLHLPSTPPPTLESVVWLPDIQWASLSLSWEKDFITEKNCGIVSPQLPLLTGEGGAWLDTGASWSDLASGVSSLTVWKASHVTHHWVIAPSPQSRTLSQPNKHQCTEQHSTSFAILYESHVRTEILYHYLCGQFSFLAEVVKALVSLMTQRLFEFFLLLHLKM